MSREQIQQDFNKVLEETVLKVSFMEKLLAITGVGSITIAGFIAEVGDIRRFDSSKQIQKYAGLELVESSSGKHKRRTRISKQGRRKLRKSLIVITWKARYGDEYGNQRNKDNCRVQACA